MRPKWEKELALCRADLASDPEVARLTAAALIKDARSNGERVRATLTLGSAEIASGWTDKYREAIDLAGLYPRPGRLARGELAGFRARLFLLSRDVESALDQAQEYVDLVAPLAASAPPPSRRGVFQAASVVPRSALAAALITRAEVRFEMGQAAAALEDALEALPWIDPRFVPHVHIAGISAVGATLVQPRIATPDRAREVLRLCALADRLLGRRRVKTKSPHRLRIKGLRALALATLGSLERAEDLMLKTIEGLSRAGDFKKDVDVFVEYLVWIVGHRGGQTGRAALLAARYGGQVRPPQKSSTYVDDSEDPIGF